jgi:MraZ protein
LFQGSHPYHIDDKGRLKVPADFVHGLGSPFTITRGLDGCLWLLPQEEWLKLVNKLDSERLVDQRALMLQRYFVGAAVTAPLDNQGRLTLSPVLRAHAGIEHEVIFVGVGSKIELWSTQRWNEYQSRISNEMIEEYARAAGL